MNRRTCSLFAILAGCGGTGVASDKDSGSPEAEVTMMGHGGSDAGSISENTCEAQDLGAGITCTHYCATFMSTCSAAIPDVYDDLAQCMSECPSFSQEQICCRGYHADLAATTPSPNAVPTHCPHAAGRSVCP
jgi:hypothetical protein